MKKIFILLALVFAIASTITAQTGNVGIGTNDPKTKLDVNGAITNREVEYTVASNTVTIGNNVGQARINGAATAQINVTAPTGTNATPGQRLVLYNNATGGYTAVLNSFPIPSGMAVEFAYSDGGWRSVKPIPMIAMIETSGAQMTKDGTNTTKIPNPSLKVNTIPGATYDAANSRMNLPSGTYQITLVVEGDFNVSGNNTSNPIHSFYYDFQKGAADWKRIHVNTPGNSGGASNFGITIQYITTITENRNFNFELGWGQGGNVNNNNKYNIANGTQLSFVKIL